MSPAAAARDARRRLVRAIDEQEPLAVVRERYAVLVLATTDTVTEAAEKLGVTRRTVHRLIERGRKS